MRSLVSVITPTYNRSALLQRAADSALRQTYSDVEVVIVDDGSTDDTEDAVRTRYGAEPRVRYFRQKNRGVSAARNRAMVEARGDFIAFLDSDDAWLPWKLELQLSCMKRAPEVGMVWSDMRAIGPNGNLVAERYLRSMYRAWRWFPAEMLFEKSYPLGGIAPDIADAVGARFYVGDVFSAMVMGNLVHTSTVLLRRERYEKVHGFALDFDAEESRAGEDYDFHLRTCREGPVGFVDVSTMDYQTGLPDRLTRFSLVIARNFLTTVDRTLVRDRHRITLPPAMINEVRAEAHAWLAACLIEVGDRHAARQHLVASLRRKPQQGRVWAELALCCAPSSFDRGLRRAYQAIRIRG